MVDFRRKLNYKMKDLQMISTANLQGFDNSMLTESLDFKKRSSTPSNMFFNKRKESMSKTQTKLRGNQTPFSCYLDDIFKEDKENEERKRMSPFVK